METKPKKKTTSTKAPTSKSTAKAAPATPAAAPKAKAKAAPRKATTRRKAAAPATLAAAVTSAPDLTDAISVRAYYLSERRLRLGLPGDSAQDWLEAEVQVRAEFVSGSGQA